MKMTCDSLTVAVLLPVYNKDNPLYFEKAIDSLLCQTYTNVLILIGVDGFVSGELADFLRSLEQRQGIEVVYFENNRGVACVLNDLIAVAKQYGVRYLARMDADDICAPDRIERQLNFLENNPDIDVVGGAIAEIDGNSIPNGKLIKYPITHNECRAFFRYRDCLAHPATFFRMRFFEKANGYRAEYRKNQDTMLWFDGFMNGCVFANLPNVVLYFRITEDFYKRRNGWKRAVKMLNDRFVINHDMRFGFSAYLFAFAMFCMTITPPFIKKWIYRMR